MQRKTEFHFEESDFFLIRDKIKFLAGIKLADHKKAMVYSRLARSLRRRKLNTFDDYLKLIEADPDELIQFINSLTTNLTSFFREEHHFEYMCKTIIPEILNRHQSDKVIRIWSAGCSTGEEAYSIAITLCEQINDIEQWDINILATDLDTSVLKKGDSGQYDVERIAGIQEELKRKYFLKGSGQNEGVCRVKKRICDMVSFKKLNLIEPPWSISQPFDIIFCRNVLIYFEPEVQYTVLQSLLFHLISEGHLFLGHSESIGDNSHSVQHLGRTWYRKTSDIGDDR